MDKACVNQPLLCVTEAEFSFWLATAERHSLLKYHDGFLAMDVANRAGPLSVVERRELVAVAGLARWASEQGIVHLLQRRLGPARFSYLAVMRKTGAQDQRSAR